METISLMDLQDSWIENLLCQNESILNYNQLWNTTIPRFSRCFQKTIPIWVPAGIFWLLAPCQVYIFARNLDPFRRNCIPWNWFNTTRLLTVISIVLVNLIRLVFDGLSFWDGKQFIDRPTLIADITGTMLNLGTFTLLAFLLCLHRLSGLHTSALGWIFSLLCLIFASPSAYMHSMYFWNRTAYQEVIQSLSVCDFVLFTVEFVAFILLFVLNCFADASKETISSAFENDSDFDQNYEERRLWRRTSLSPQEELAESNLTKCPELRASFLSRFTYWWFNSLALTGYRKTLSKDDLWRLLPEDKTDYVGTRFSRNWDSQSLDEKKPGTLRALIRTYGGVYLYGCLFQLINILLSFVHPQLLKIFIDFIAIPEEPVWHGYAIAALLFTASTLQSLMFVHFLRIMLTTGNRIRNSLISAIYRKAMTLSSAARRSTSSGQIVNLMSVDAQHFVDLLTDLDLLWGAPLQISLTMFFLWQELGAAIFAGIAFMVLLMPLNWWLSRFETRFYEKQMETKDERVNVINEMFGGIRVIKLYGWELPFIDKVTSIRNRETGLLKKIAYLNAVTSIFWTCTPFWVSFVSFAVYVLSSDEHVLDAKKAFVSLALFELLRYPLASIPQMINQAVVTSVSLKRLTRYLNADELKNYVTREPSYSDEDIVVENGSFCWGEAEAAVVSDDDEDESTEKENSKDNTNKEESSSNGESSSPSTSPSTTTNLSSINLRIKRGTLVAIVGQVGSGKSSLLSAILGDMELLEGGVNIAQSASIAYVSQQSWIRNATLRDNILFGSEYQESRYNSVLRMCALKADIDILPGGDLTEIGEKGINLSGGQKQRVAIARACYANPDIILMDDPLSAVDSHVAKHIFNHVLSNSTGYLQGRTRVLVTNNITILPEVDQIVLLVNGSIHEIGTYQELMENGGKLADLVKEHGTDAESLQETPGMYTEQQPETPNSPKPRDYSNKEQQDRLIEEEHAEEGQVKWSVYSNYLKSLTYLWLGLLVIGFIGTQAAEVGSEVWLAIWSNDPISANSTAPPDLSLRNERLLVYGLLGLANAVLCFLSSIALTKGTIHSSVTLHRKLLDRVMRAPIQFFDTTPLGRIVNRFSKDMDIVDGTIPYTVEGWIICLLHVVSTFFLIIMQVPIFTLVVLPLLGIYYFVQKFYIATSRQLSRLESVTLSPIYSHFGETISGVSTIRAFDRTTAFVTESNRTVDANQRIFYPSIMANRWLALRLEFCGNLIVFFAAIFSILSRSAFHDKPGFIGLIITYALGITETLNWLVRNTSEMENSIVSVERIAEYSQVEQEHEWTRAVNADPELWEQWPDKGGIDFVDYSLRYREGLDLVLKDINIEVKSGEKIGIVGRTGAGKSSLTLALFRILESAGGKILIDGVDVSRIGLHELRSKLSIIPQDPVFFSGTIRSNLDPFNYYPDDQIWIALEHCHLKDHISSLESGLSHPVSENGANLSVGQRQLLCLGRALLRKTRILILDEATAAIDLETDSLIQSTIREQFAQCTILTIAHRLHTIMDSSRVLVLHQGQVVEFDTPERLLADQSSRFYSLAKDARII